MVFKGDERVGGWVGGREMSRLSHCASLWGLLGLRGGKGTSAVEMVFEGTRGEADGRGA